MIRLTFLSENKTEIAKCTAEFGLSMLIEAGDRTILFDAGYSGMFAANARALGIDLSSVDLCVISHGHCDHTDGFPLFGKLNDHAKIYVHKDAFYPTFGMVDGVIIPVNGGIRWTPEQSTALKDRLVLTDGPVWLDENTVISGTIPDIPEYKPAGVFFLEIDPGSRVQDDLRHEQFLAIRDEGGICLFSGCSHKGIVAAIEYAKQLFPGERIKTIVAGMHLMATPAEQLRRIIDRIEEEHPDVIIPMHCTGLRAITEMRIRFGERCMLAGAGFRCEL